MASQPPPEAISLNDPPSDGITSLTYLPGEPHCLLASTSWDGSVRVHNTSTKSAVLCHAMDSGPLLSLAKRNDATAVATGGLDGSGELYAKLSYRFRGGNRLFASVSPFSLTPITSVLAFLQFAFLIYRRQLLR